jgi:hypothetical protein
MKDSVWIKRQETIQDAQFYCKVHADVKAIPSPKLGVYAWLKFVLVNVALTHSFTHVRAIPWPRRLVYGLTLLRTALGPTPVS